MTIFSASPNSLVLGDLYALQQLIFESGIGFGRFYFKLEEGSFQRPSYYIKIISSTLNSQIKSYRQITSQIMVQYFTEDFYEAQTVANDLQVLLSGGPYSVDVLLPRYDFSTLPPTKLSINGYDSDRMVATNYEYYEGGGSSPAGVMGARIDPTTISNGGVIQEANRGFNVPITFSMLSPVTTFPHLQTIEDIHFEVLTGQPIFAQIVEVTNKGEVSVDQVEPC